MPSAKENFQKQWQPFVVLKPFSVLWHLNLTVNGQKVFKYIKIIRSFAVKSDVLLTRAITGRRHLIDLISLCNRIPHDPPWCHTSFSSAAHLAPRCPRPPDSFGFVRLMWLSPTERSRRSVVLLNFSWRSTQLYAALTSGVYHPVLWFQRILGLIGKLKR